MFNFTNPGRDTGARRPSPSWSRSRTGEIFNETTLTKIQDVQREVDKIPGVDHNEVLSLASYRVTYAESSPGTLTINPFMFPKVPSTPEGIAALRNSVTANRAAIAHLVSADLKSRSSCSAASR